MKPYNSIYQNKQKKLKEFNNIIKIKFEDIFSKYLKLFFDELNLNDETYKKYIKEFIYSSKEEFRSRTEEINISNNDIAKKNYKYLAERIIKIPDLANLFISFGDINKPNKQWHKDTIILKLGRMKENDIKKLIDAYKLLSLFPDKNIFDINKRDYISISTIYGEIAQSIVQKVFQKDDYAFEIYLFYFQSLMGIGILDHAIYQNIILKVSNDISDFKKQLKSKIKEKKVVLKLLDLIDNSYEEEFKVQIDMIKQYSFEHFVPITTLFIEKTFNQNSEDIHRFYGLNNKDYDNYTMFSTIVSDILINKFRSMNKSFSFPRIGLDPHSVKHAKEYFMELLDQDIVTLLKREEIKIIFQ